MKKRNLTEEQQERAELRELVDSNYWGVLVGWLEREAAALSREWPSMRGEDAIKLQGQMLMIDKIKALQKRIRSDDDIIEVKKTKSMEEE
jgi:hypothetical protein